MKRTLRTAPWFALLLINLIWIATSTTSSSTAHAAGNRLNGLHRATVVNASDPMGKGRVQITFESRPQYSGWALPCAPYSSRGISGLAIPPVGSQVWVEFERGNPDNPVWMGVVY